MTTMMPSSAIHITVAEHGKDIETLKVAQREDRSEIRSIKNWLMATLAAALGGTLMQLFAMLYRGPGK